MRVPRLQPRPLPDTQAAAGGAGYCGQVVSGRAAGGLWWWWSCRWVVVQWQEVVELQVGCGVVAGGGGAAGELWCQVVV